MAGDKVSTKDQSFSFNDVAALLAALKDAGVTVGAKHYQLMSKIENTRTASGYEHLFRKAKKTAEEISGKIDRGEFDGVEAKAPSTKRGGGSAKKDRKRGHEDNQADDADDEELKGSPSKRGKSGKIKEELPDDIFE